MTYKIIGLNTEELKEIHVYRETVGDAEIAADIMNDMGLYGVSVSIWDGNKMIGKHNMKGAH